jgi:hypothetical protein
LRRLDVIKQAHLLAADHRLVAASKRLVMLGDKLRVEKGGQCP